MKSEKTHDAKYGRHSEQHEKGCQQHEMTSPVKINGNDVD